MVVGGMAVERMPWLVRVAAAAALVRAALLYILAMFANYLLLSSASFESCTMQRASVQTY